MTNNCIITQLVCIGYTSAYDDIYLGCKTSDTPSYYKFKK